MTIIGGGLVLREPDLLTYTHGTTVVLTPTASPDWFFAGWSGPDAGDLIDHEDGSWSITMDASKRLTATFTEDRCSLALTLSGSGSVLREPDLPTYVNGTLVVLTPTATLGWTFAGWSGPDVSDLTDNRDGSWSITMDASKVLTATFTQDEYTLSVSVIGLGGSVGKSPDQPTYTYGTPVVLTPTASLGWTFAGWSGPDVADLTDNEDGSWSLSMDTSKELVAIFTYRVYLPMIMNRWPPIPSVPSLNPIDNAGGDGNYEISWSAAVHADTYVLQEATNSSFSDASIVYSGPSTSHAVSGRGAARYYYRVKARNIWAESDWSNIRSVDVLWEAEPNDDYSLANGPIVPDLVYYGTFPSEDDISDYYFFELSARRRVEMWLSNIPSGHDYNLVLRDDTPDLTVVGYSAQLGNSNEHIRIGILPPGRYYVQVYHYSSGGSTQRYYLKYVLE